MHTRKEENTEINKSFIIKKHLLIRLLKDLNLFSEYHRCFRRYDRENRSNGPFNGNVNKFILRHNRGNLIMYAFKWDDSKVGGKLWQEIYKKYPYVIDFKYIGGNEYSKIVNYLKTFIKENEAKRDS